MEMKQIKRRNRRRERQRRKNRSILAVLICLLVLGLASAYTIVSFVKREVTIEYGEKLSSDLFKRYGFGNVALDVSSEEILTPGTHDIVANFGPFKYNCKLIVVDTTAPEFTLTAINMGYGKELPPDSFIEKITELSNYEVSYKTNPNWSLYDQLQSISIVVKDEWGNETIKETKLTIENYPEIVDIELGADISKVNETLSLYFGNIITNSVSENDIGKVGNIPVSLTNPNRSYNIELNIIDTTAPVLSVRDIVAPVGFETDPNVLVVDVSDLSPVDISYKNAPDFSAEGTYAVEISAKDSSGNETILPSNITLIKDTEAPVFTYALDFDSFVGENIIFRDKVKAIDNCTEEPELKIDAQSVNINATGEYTVTYMAKDLAGNASQVSLKVNIREKTEEDKELATKIEGIISKIIKEGMTKKEQAEAIYYYVYNHITYVSRPKQNHVKAALEAINGRGGCFNYASLAMFLFDELGIKNMFMETNVHYWNIIDIDDGHGWYHFDATPSPEEPKIFLWTDAQMMSYSNRQNRTHHYDRSKYPVIP